jgi:hypothetical protein
MPGPGVNRRALAAAGAVRARAGAVRAGTGGDEMVRPGMGGGEMVRPRMVRSGTVRPRTGGAGTVRPRAGGAGTGGGRMARPGTSQVGRAGRRAEAGKGSEGATAVTGRLVLRSVIPRLVTRRPAVRQTFMPWPGTRGPARAVIAGPRRATTVLAVPAVAVAGIPVTAVTVTRIDVVRLAPARTAAHRSGVARIPVPVVPIAGLPVTGVVKSRSRVPGPAATGFGVVVLAATGTAGPRLVTDGRTVAGAAVPGVCPPALLVRRPCAAHGDGSLSRVAWCRRASGSLHHAATSRELHRNGHRYPSLVEGLTGTADVDET